MPREPRVTCLKLDGRFRVLFNEAELGHDSSHDASCRKRCVGFVWDKSGVNVLLLLLVLRLRWLVRLEQTVRNFSGGECGQPVAASRQ